MTDEKEDSVRCCLGRDQYTTALTSGYYATYPVSAPIQAPRYLEMMRQRAKTTLHRCHCI